MEGLFHKHDWEIKESSNSFAEMEVIKLEDDLCQGVSDTRTEAEEAAFKKAFKILETKLKNT